jgi:hypothetical protein
MPGVLSRRTKAGNILTNTRSKNKMEKPCLSLKYSKKAVRPVYLCLPWLSLSKKENKKRVTMLKRKLTRKKSLKKRRKTKISNKKKQIKMPIKKTKTMCPQSQLQI